MLARPASIADSSRFRPPIQQGVIRRRTAEQIDSEKRDGEVDKYVNLCELVWSVLTPFT